MRGARLAFAEWRPFLVEPDHRRTGRRRCWPRCCPSCWRGGCCARSTSLPRATRRAGRGRDRRDRARGGRGRAGRARALVQRHGRRARARPRVAARLSGVGQPRAQDAADLDPGLRRGAGGGRGRRRRRAGASSPPRPTGWNGWCSTCWTWPGWAARASTSSAGRVDLAAVGAAAVQRHLPRAEELGRRSCAAERGRPGAGASATRAACCRPPPTSSRTPCGSPRPAGSVRGLHRAGDDRRARHRARASPPRTCPAPLSASTSTTATAQSARSAPGWAWRSSRSWWRRWAARSRRPRPGRRRASS